MEKINNNTYININSIQSLQIINDKYYVILTSGSKIEITKDQFDELSVSHGIPGEIVNKNTIGNLTDLTTTDKSNIVSAINELNNKKYEFVYMPINEEIIKVEEIITYLNNQNINISDYLGKIIIFETNTASIDNDKWNFIIIPTNYDLEGVLICSDGIYRIYFSSDGYYVSQYAQVLDIKYLVGELNNLTTSNKNNLVGAINEVNKNTNKNELELIDLKEALYGYVFGPEPTPVEIESTIPTTTTINDTTYNLVDNVRGLIESVNGNTVKSENLLVLNDVEEKTVNGITYSVKNGVLSVRGTASAETTIGLNISLNVNAGKYYLKVFNWTTNLGIDYYFINSAYTYEFYNTSDGLSSTNTKTYLASELLRSIQFKIANGTAISGTLQLKPMLVKGTTAPTEFKQGFNGLKSVEYAGLKISGRNLFDGEIRNGGYNESNGAYYEGNTVCDKNGIVVKPNTTYTYNANGTLKLYYYNNNTYLGCSDKFVNSLTFTTPNNCNIIRFRYDVAYGSVYQNDFIINVGTTALQYTPYKEPITLLPFNTTLRGVGPAKDKIVISKNSDNEYYTATKVSNIGVVDLGTLDWQYNSNQKECFRAALSLSKIGTGSEPNILTTKYETGSQPTAIATNGYISIFNGTNILFIHDNSITEGDYASFKNAMSGVMLVYELAEPTQEVLSTTLTEAEVMTLLELGGSVEIVNSNSDFVNGSTTIEMVYKLINS